MNLKQHTDDEEELSEVRKIIVTKTTRYVNIPNRISKMMSFKNGDYVRISSGYNRDGDNIMIIEKVKG